MRINNMCATDVISTIANFVRFTLWLSSLFIMDNKGIYGRTGFYDTKTAAGINRKDCQTTSLHHIIPKLSN